MVTYFVHYIYQERYSQERLEASIVVQSDFLRDFEDYLNLKEIIENELEKGYRPEKGPNVISIKDFKCLDTEYLLHKFLKSQNIK